MFCIELRTFKFFNNPESFEVLADETRRRMIYLLRAKEQTVSQLAESLGKTPQAIYHQIKILLDNGFVEIAKEERVDHFIETYYRATAEVFEFSHGENPGREVAEQLKEVPEALAQIGLKVNADDELLSKVAKLEGKISALGMRPELEEKIQQLDDVGFFTRQHAYRYAQMATMTDKQFDEMITATRELRQLLTQSLARAPAQLSHGPRAEQK
jgi:DNA-binding transcriptional ArsR family regulator